MKKAWILALGAVAGLLGSGLLGSGLLGSSIAQAQSAPDIRNIRPVVMLLVDTSGSMERMSGGSSAPLPMCSGSASGTNEHNRWTTVLEALTGSWPSANFFCTDVDRTASAFLGQPDYRYFLPYHQPSLSVSQMNDGILDVYLDRIKFGLMTFDNTYTFRDPPLYVNTQLMPQTMFMARSGENLIGPGEFSYGGPKPLSFPGCGTTYMVDTGARNESAQMGRLVSVGTESDDPRAINQTIQDVLLNTRPYGATPTSSLLDDFRYYATNHPDMTSSDPYSECRNRYVLLLTDGQPDAEFRDRRFNCESSGGCPYQRATTIAADLCRYSGSDGACTGEVDGVYVVAFDVTDSTAVSELNAIADVGGTTSALLASDRSELMARISEVLDMAAPGTTTRTRAAFATGTSTFTGGQANQMEFNAGFHVSTTTGKPWTGVLERTRYLCSATMVPTAEPVSARVRFDQVLNARTTDRVLYTVATPDPTDVTGNLIGTDATTVPLGATSPSGAVTGQSLVPFDSGHVSPEHLGLSGGSRTTLQTERDYIINWVNGNTPDRVDARMGDIYHSSPVAVGPPVLDIADESYNLFRRRADVSTRPTVVYVGTNDGVLHAFVADDWTNPATGDSRSAGEELWGFIPPVLLPKLQSATASHQIMVDGTPLVRDVFFKRQPTDNPNASIYHTVLLMGFRAGAPGYFALDVTDPFHPSFLWQYVGEQPSGHSSGGSSITPLGYSYGRPAIGQVLVDVGGTLQERAVALLPGGSGDLDTDRVHSTGPVGCPAQGVGQPPVTSGTTNARSHQRCWSNRGRILTWVDMVTGEVIRTFDQSVFNAPLTGGVALYPGDVGTDAQRAFFTDADGVIWAVDFSKRNPADWAVRPFHDIFWDGSATGGQPAYAPPVVSVDDQGNLVVLVGTGDIDRLDGTAANRVVSLTEQKTFSSAGAATYATVLNWEVRLHDGEQVTGPIELFESNAYFGTFESGDPTNACSFGQSRIWGVNYLKGDGSPPAGYTNPASAFPEAHMETVPGSGVYDTPFTGPYSNQLVLGVGITQRPTCVTGSTQIDPYIGNRYRVTNMGGGTFELRAQLSGGTASTSGAVATMSVQLPSPQSFTTVHAFSGRVDY